MLHPPSAAVRRSAYGPLCQLSNQIVSPFGGSDRSVPSVSHYDLSRQAFICYKLALCLHPILPYVPAYHLL